MGASTKHKEVDSKLLGRSLAEVSLFRMDFIAIYW